MWIINVLCVGMDMDTSVELGIKYYRAILLLGFIVIAVVGCGSSDDIEPSEPHIPSAYIHICLDGVFDCDHSLPLRILTTESDISLSGTVFASLWNGIVSGTGGCYDYDGFPLWAPPDTSITWSNTATGDQGYGRTYWGVVVYGVCRSFWEVDNIPLTWGNNELLITGRGDGRSAQTQATVTKRPEQPESVEYVKLGAEHSFTWSDSPGAASYNLYYSTAPNFTEDIPVYVNDDNPIHVSDIQSPYVLTGLDTNVNYYFAIAGVTADGVIGIPSGEQSLMTSKLKVLSTFPMAEAIDVERNIAISITFSKEISSSSLTPSIFSLYANEIELVPVNISSSGDTVSITPTEPLSPGNTYKVRIESSVEDLYNHSLASAYTWSFTTIDDVAPSIKAYKPGASEVDVYKNTIITLVFNESIDCSTVSGNEIILDPVFIGTIACDNEVIKFTPSSLLNPDTVYNVTVNAGIKDLAGNYSLNKLNWSFTTGTEIAWARNYSVDSLDDFVLSGAIETINNGYAMSGFTRSQDYTTYQYWSIKTDAEGNRVWERIEDNSIALTPASMLPDSDGGFIVAGNTHNNIGVYPTYYHAMIMKLDADGFPVWQKQYKDSSGSTTTLYSIVPVSTGGYIATGHWSSLYRRALVMRVDDTGNILWRRQYDPYCNAYSIIETSDNGYLFSGAVSDNDHWIVKLDSDGLILWDKRFATMGVGGALEKTTDGGYIIAGSTKSSSLGYPDIWLLKLDSSGAVDWQYTYGGAGRDASSAIRQTSDGGFVLAGYTESFGAGDRDIWLLKLDLNGAVQWQRTYGNAESNYPVSIELTTDGGYLIGGQTSDEWLVLKLDANGNIKFNVASDYQVNNTNVSAIAASEDPLDINIGSIIDTSAVVSTIDIPFISGSSNSEQQAP